jgi:hypothetical protein
MNTTKYEVVFEAFAERHFIKAFARKYKGSWDTTRLFLAEEYRFFDALFKKSIAETICVSGDNDVRICKTEFKIAGTEESRHSSGNRCIVAVHKNMRKVCVLLVYNKTDLRSSNETACWKALVKENYSEYAKILE